MALNCHCDDCRHATGASFRTFVFINESDLKFLQESPKTFQHPNDSGITVTKQFCEYCGSQLFGKGSRSGGMIHVKVGTIDDANFVHPEMDLFVSQKNSRSSSWKTIPNVSTKADRDKIVSSPTNGNRRMLLVRSASEILSTYHNPL